VWYFPTLMSSFGIYLFLFVVIWVFGIIADAAVLDSHCNQIYAEMYNLNIEPENTTLIINKYNSIDKQQ
jgi:hypothetical protein